MKGEKTGGRQKGTKNKKTNENLERISEVLACIHKDHLLKDIKKLSPSERVKTFIALSEYVTPKLARREITGPEGAPIELPQPIINLQITPPKELNDDE